MDVDPMSILLNRRVNVYCLVPPPPPTNETVAQSPKWPDQLIKDVVQLLFKLGGRIPYSV